MTTELCVLSCSAMLVASLWIPYAAGLLKTRGLMTPGDYEVAPSGPLPDWVNRANRAHQNSVESFAPFAAMVVVLHLSQVSTSITVGACVAYLAARVVHAIVHISGFSALRARSLVFTVSYMSVLALFVELIRNTCDG